MSTHNIGFYEDLTKIIYELSSNTHLISSAVSRHNNFFFVCRNIKNKFLDTFIIFSSKSLESIS